MDYLAKLHFDAIVQQHIDPYSDKAKAAVAKFNATLDEQLNTLFDGIPSDPSSVPREASPTL